MKRIKTLLCLSLAVITVLLLLAGCDGRTGGESSDAASKSAEVSEIEFYYSESLDENGFWQGVTALDYVEIFNYEAFSIPSDVHQISDETLTAAIDEIMENYPTRIKDRAVADGDRVNIDYVGSIDGVPFQGGSSEGMGAFVTAGSTDYIDGFLTQIIGHMPGETFDVNVTFPDPYNNPDLAGKPAVFVTTINYIAGEGKLELTDAFVLENMSAKGWTTVEQMKAGMRKELQDQAIQKYIDQFLGTDVNVRSIPDQVLKYQENNLVNSYQMKAKNNGMPLEVYLTFEDITTVEELLEKYRDNISGSSKYSLAIQAVAEHAGISVSDQDLTEFAPGYSDYLETYGLPFFKQYALNGKVLRYITEHAVLA